MTFIQSKAQSQNHLVLHIESTAVIVIAPSIVVYDIVGYKEDLIKSINLIRSFENYLKNQIQDKFKFLSLYLFC